MSFASCNGGVPLNIAYGNANQIPFQISPSQTGFLLRESVRFTSVAADATSQIDTNIPLASKIFFSSVPILNADVADANPFVWITSPVSGATTYQLYISNNSSATAITGNVYIWYEYIPNP